MQPPPSRQEGLHLNTISDAIFFYYFYQNGVAGFVVPTVKAKPTTNYLWLNRDGHGNRKTK